MANGSDDTNTVVQQIEQNTANPENTNPPTNTGEASAKLHLIANPEAVEPSDEQLLEIAKELMAGEVSPTVLELPEVRAKLVSVFEKRRTDKAEADERERKRVFKLQVNTLLQKANTILNPPPPTMIPIVLKKLPTREDRLRELQAKYGQKLPDCVFNPESHHQAMGLKGGLIGVKMNFDKDLAKANADDKIPFKNKSDSLQRLIDVVSEIVKVGYELDPNDRKNHCPTDLFKKEILPLFNTHPNLIMHCKMPDTKAEREQREHREAEANAKAEAEREQQEDERARLIASIVVLMLEVDHLKSLAPTDVQTIARRVATKFDGKTPEQKLKQAAREKCGGDVSPENRKLGLSLAKAAKCTEDEISQMFPVKNGEKKNKKKQKK